MHALAQSLENVFMVAVLVGALAVGAMVVLGFLVWLAGRRRSR